MVDDHPVYSGPYQKPPQRRRGRTLLIATVVLLFVAVGLLVIADRVAAGVAERAIADRVGRQIAGQQVASSPPEVTVGGFPFLTQVLAGRYESISISLRDARVAVDGDSIRLRELAIDARNVTASLSTIRSGRGEVVAESVEGTGTVGYSSVANLMNRPGLQLNEQDGKLVVTAPLEILGQQLTVSGTATLSVDDGMVQVRFDELTTDGLPSAAQARSVIASYAQQFSVDIPLPDLPFQLDVQDVRALPEGLAVTATAKNVPLDAVT
ncbi:MAG TPA: DUF2993 domain-containing protein [Micromonospora sp.]|nr:DUF2993 domain-containing protein [Micromonospora sp.]